MRKLLLAIVVLCAAAWPQSAAPNPSPQPAPSKAVQKEARKAFKEGTKKKSQGHTAEALQYFTRATDLDPTNLEYVTEREKTRQLAVYQAIERGNNALLAGDRIQAMAAFRSALEFDPENEFARQRLMDSIPYLPKISHEETPDPFAAAAETHLAPRPEKHSFNFRGNSRQLLEQIATAYGLTAAFDESVQNRPVRFTVDDIDWATAADIAARMTKVFWTPLSAKQVLFVADSEQNRRQLQRTALRTFYIGGANTPQELNEIGNLLRVLFDIRFLTIQPGAKTLVIRASQPVVDAATTFLEGVAEGRPQVLLDIHVFEVSRKLAQQVGATVPTTFTAYNVPTVAQQALGNQSIQSLVNQLIASGAINQANSSAIAGLIAQALGGQGNIFNQSYFTFGGGITLTAVVFSGYSFHFNQNTSDLQTLEHVTLRASQADPAVFKAGTRYPIVNGTYSPIYNTPQIAQVIANQTYRAPVPSITFEDLGLVMKATPSVREKDLTLKLELQLRALGSISVNGVPVISNREYTGTISAADGESVVIAGLISNTERRGLTGAPLLGQVPGAGVAFAKDSKDREGLELLIVMTPHIVRRADRVPLQILMPATTTR